MINTNVKPPFTKEAVSVHFILFEKIVEIQKQTGGNNS
jgi:hypothetical protein